MWEETLMTIRITADLMAISARAAPRGENELKSEGDTLRSLDTETRGLPALSLLT